MPLCYYLPGFMGSTLSRDRAGGPLVWVNPLVLAAGGMELLRLDDAGLSPGNPSGPAIFASDFYVPTYAAGADALEEQLAPSGHHLVRYPWDWRLRLETTARRLSADILADGISLTNPCSIVGHSAGGLVARLVWSMLSAQGMSHIVRRIVTVGTPHYGTWSAVQLLLGIEPTLQYIAQFERVARGLRYQEPNQTQIGSWIQTYLAGIASTWPSVYQLLPALYGPEFDADPARAQYYEPASYADLGWVSARQLAFASGPWQLAMSGADTRPPRDVLRIVLGNGSITAGNARTVEDGRVIRGSWSPADGDSVVTFASALLGDAFSEYAGLSHVGLAYTPFIWRTIERLLLDEVPPPPPAPPRSLPLPPLQSIAGLVPLISGPGGQLTPGDC